MKPAGKACERKGIGDGDLKDQGRSGQCLEASSRSPSGTFYVGLRLTTRRRLRRRVRFRRKGIPCTLVVPITFIDSARRCPQFDAFQEVCLLV
jgi:hypothetical protein